MGGSGFPFSLSEWSLTICLTPYNRRKNVLSVSLNKTFLSLSHHRLVFLPEGWHNGLHMTIFDGNLLNDQLEVVSQPQFLQLLHRNPARVHLVVAKRAKPWPREKQNIPDHLMYKFIKSPVSKSPVSFII